MKKILNIFMVLFISFASGCQGNLRGSDVTADYVRDYLIIVNDQNPYDFDGEYATNLQDDLARTYQADSGDDELLEYKTLEHFHQLKIAARKQGIEIGLVSGYRTKENQQWLYDNYELTPQVKPGYSEHHTGLNISIAINGYLPNGEGPYWLSEGDKIPENAKLTKLLPDYGFIRRYPVGKEDLTGHDAAPYEIRFVGSPEIAHTIMDNGLCLEEYVSKHSHAYE